MKKYVIGIILLSTVVFAGCLEDNVGFASNDTQFSIDGLAGHWSFDEDNGNVVYDYSGNDNDGSIYPTFRTLAKCRFKQLLKQ